MMPARGPWAALSTALLLLAGGEAFADLRSALSPFIPVVEVQREAVTDAQPDVPDSEAADSETPDPDTPGPHGQAASGAEPNPEQAAAARPDPDPVYIRVGEETISPFSERLLAEFYAARDYQPAWGADQAREMLEVARESRFEGFLPADFHADAIAGVIDSDALNSADPAVRDNAELLLSDALARYVHHVRYGKRNPEVVNRAWTFVEPGDAGQLQADMAAALAGGVSLGGVLAARLPNPDFYRNLKKGYRRYLEIAERHGWEKIPAGANLSLGVSGPRVPLVREHLRVLDGYEPGLVTEPERYDEGLAEAVKGFQRRSGLGADGVVGPNTLRALNQPLDERLTTIRANLERMRWLHNDLPEDYLFVDLTAYELYLVRGGEEVWRTKGVIGTTENQTPMFRDEMEYLVFNPTWTVPRSIEKKFRGVPAGYKRVRSGGQYYLVQEPGPRNALGRVKFMFPNGHAIYLHDTPSRHLFSRSQRAYSHGCVRVHQPLTLAEQVLNKPAWSEGEINRVVRRGATRWVHLDEHLPVLLYYLTAKADDEGRVGFRRDVYNRDQRLIAALDTPADVKQRIVFAEPEPAEELLAEVPTQAPATPTTDEDDRSRVAGGDRESVAAVGSDTQTQARSVEASAAEATTDVASTAEDAGTLTDDAEPFQAPVPVRHRSEDGAGGSVATAVAETQDGTSPEVRERPASRHAAPDEGLVVTQPADLTDAAAPAEAPARDTAPGDTGAAVEPDAEAAAEPPSPAVSSELVPPSAARPGELRMDLDAAGRFPGVGAAGAEPLSPVRLDFSPRVSSITIPELAPKGEIDAGGALEADAPAHLNPAVWRLPAD